MVRVINLFSINLIFCYVSYYIFSQMQVTNETDEKMDKWMDGWMDDVMMYSTI